MWDEVVQAVVVCGGVLVIVLRSVRGGGERQARSSLTLISLLSPAPARTPLNNLKQFEIYFSENS